MKSNYTTENIFTDVKRESFPRHKFNKSYTCSFTCNHGYAIPFFVDDVIPGDRIDLNSYGRVQLQPLATASMQNIRAYMRYFYVPYRLIWKDWDKFISQDGFVDTPLLAPFTELTGGYLDRVCNNVGGLLDMLGLGVTNVKNVNGVDEIQQLGTLGSSVSFTLFRNYAYYLIWDTYFRDENLQSPVLDSIPELVSGVNRYDPMFDTLLPVAYEKDYFTTALPWQQKGEPVSLNAYLVSNGGIRLRQTYNDGIDYCEGYVRTGNNNNNTSDHTEPLEFWADFDTVAPNNPQPLVRTAVDLAPQQFATSVNINDLRYSNALQRYLERLALGGNRPAEFYLSMYGVRVPDLRIGQPLYLGGGYEYVHVTPITQQSESNITPQGTLAGNGTSTPQFGINESYYCEEPGIVMGIFYLRPEINYSQGVPRIMQTFSHLDYYNPIFAHLGEEAVKTSELYIGEGFSNYPLERPLNHYNDTTFGFQSRYAYLKHRRNEIHGEFKTTLSEWLLSTHFVEQPVLNSDFITVQQNYDIFAVQREDLAHHYLCEFRHNYEVESSMPDFSIPSL